jgi:hypothetical protein
VLFVVWASVCLLSCCASLSRPARLPRETNLSVLFTFEAAALHRRFFVSGTLPQSFVLVRRNLSLIYVFETSGQENCPGYWFCSMVALAEVTAQHEFCTIFTVSSLRTFLEG